MITIPYTPYHFHLLCMSGFASLVAPFGGFFASGFKRAFNIKDFGHSIPGHGGMTDRMDCQCVLHVARYLNRRLIWAEIFDGCFYLRLSWQPRPRASCHRRIGLADDSQRINTRGAVGFGF